MKMIIRMGTKVIANKDEKPTARVFVHARGRNMRPSCASNRNSGRNETTIIKREKNSAHSHRRRQAGGTRTVLLSLNYCGLVPPGIPVGSTGRTHVPSAGMDENSGRGLLVLVGHHAGSHLDGHFHPRKAAAGIGKPGFKSYAGTLFAGFTTLLKVPQDDVATESGIPAGD